MNRCLCNRRNQWENGPCDYCLDERCEICNEYECVCEADND